jgi:hypothetical protein
MDFAHRYNSVKRFVRTLRKHEPERFDILDGLPGPQCHDSCRLNSSYMVVSGNIKS